jgi:hypothetical protein
MVARERRAPVFENPDQPTVSQIFGHDVFWHAGKPEAIEACVNTISPGIVITPLAKDELTGPRGEGYRRMIELCPVGRAATPDEVGSVGALPMGPDGAFITGSDFLMDGGVTASYWFGELAAK